MLNRPRGFVVRFYMGWNLMLVKYDSLCVYGSIECFCDNLERKFAISKVSSRLYGYDHVVHAKRAMQGDLMLTINIGDEVRLFALCD